MVVIATVTLRDCDQNFSQNIYIWYSLQKMENGAHITLLNKSYDLNIPQINLG